VERKLGGEELAVGQPPHAVRSEQCHRGNCTGQRFEY
jgi:hypothetical protein